MAEPWEYFHTKRILNQYGLPSGAFNPEAEQAYDIYFMNIRTKPGNLASKPLAPEATLKVAAVDEGENRRLGITYSALMDDDTTQIDVRCKKNALTSPTEWTLTFSNANVAGQGLVA